MELDVSKKRCLADNERFADLINGLLFEGQEQVRAEDLQEADTQGNGFGRLFPKGMRYYRQMYRDLIKKVCMGVNFAVIGVENQELVHYLMPMRSMSYDAAEYDRQARMVRRKVRRLRGLSRAEYLSGFRKNDKLHPCITLVLYYGENWDGARSLHELLDFEGISPQLREYINDYPIHVFEVRKLADTAVFRTDLRQIFEFIKCSSDKRKLRTLVQSDPAYQEMDEDAYDMAVQYAEVGQLMDIKTKYERGGKINMCKAFDEMLEDERMEGREEGREEGHTAAIRSVVINMVKRGKSDEEIIELTECSAELIWEIRQKLQE